METFEQSTRTRLGRYPTRGVFDRDAVYRILDEAFICHVGFCDEEGRPVVIPTGFGRKGDRLYIHGSAASRMLRGLASRIPVCVTVTLMDGFVLARSAFHHSMNYRSVVVFGEAEPVVSEDEKYEALRVLTEHLVPGRWADVRKPEPKEMKATSVLTLDLSEVSAKVRTGGPIDDAEDMNLPVWAGVLPVRFVTGEGKLDASVRVPVKTPEYVAHYRRPGNGSAE